jgi:iron complex transport system substrate-binding protein
MIALASIALMACTIPGCLQDDSSGDRIFIDDLGGTLRMNAAPMRIVSLTPALTEIVFLLGCGDRLVGIDSDSNYPPEASGIEKVSDWQDIFKEKIVSIDPDLILMDKTLDNSNKRYDQLIDLGFPVYRIYPKNTDTLLRDIGEIGKILDVEAMGEDVVASLGGRIDSVSAQALSDTGSEPSILHIVYYDGTSDPWVMTSSTFSGDLVEIAGGKNAIDDTAGISVQVSVEMMISADPDIILCSQSAIWPTPSKDKISSDPSLKDVSAVKMGFVREVDGDLIERTGPRLVDGLEAIRAIVAEYHAGG